MKGAFGLRLGVILGACLGGCHPSGQILFYVDSDAPIPADPLAPAVDRPPWLFDAIRFDVIEEGGALLATQDFVIDEGQLRREAVSIGIAPPSGTPLSVRVRLFRYDRVIAGEPPPAITLDSRFRLPAIAADEHLALTGRLYTEDVGRARGVELPLDAELGRPGVSSMGTWPGAERILCSKSAPPGAVCVPGGAFLMGDPSLAYYVSGGGDRTDLAEERVVALSPFFLGAHEVKVREFRGLLPTLLPLSFPNDPLRRESAGDPTKISTWCVYTDQPDAFEEMPVNCLSWATARSYCRALGGDLPSEAQLEFAGSGRGQEWRYPWGNDDPTCGDATWGLGEYAGSAVVTGGKTSSTCRPSAALGGVLPSGAGARDRVLLSSGTIVDLAGNTSEWARDAFSRRDEAYWSEIKIRTDPVADLRAVSGVHPTRAGSWLERPFRLRAAIRGSLPDNASAATVGFRCAWPGR